MEPDVEKLMGLMTRHFADQQVQKQEGEIEIVEMNAWVSFATTHAGDIRSAAEYANGMLEELRKTFHREPENGKS